MGCGYGESWIRARGKNKRTYIPALPMPLAIICCVLNFLVPGLGTIISSFCVFCCARNEDMTCSHKCGSCTVVFLFGLLQLVGTAILLLGWIWSCVWGVMYVGMSSEYYHSNPVDRDTTAYPRAVTQQPTTVYPQRQPDPPYSGQAQSHYPGHYPYGAPQSGPSYPPSQYTHEDNFHPGPSDNRKNIPQGPRAEPSAPMEPPPPYEP